MLKHFGSIMFVWFLAGGCTLPVQAGSDRPVTSREIGQLKEEISDATTSSLEGIVDYHNENGDLNNRLDFWRFGARLNYKANSSTTYYVSGVETNYLTTNSFLNEHGTNVTAGLKKTLSDSVETQLEGGATHFSTGSSTVNLMGTLRYKYSDMTTLYVMGSRTNVEESLLSSAGIRPQYGPFAGKLVGEVMDNRVVAGARFQLTPQLDAFGEGGGGARTGQNIETNSMRVANAGAGYNLFAADTHSALSLVRASYALDYFGFDKNLFGYGGASFTTGRGQYLPVSLVGADGISPVATAWNAGVGGYFSPENFVSNVARIEFRGRPRHRIEYDASAFLGAQSYTGSDTRQAAGFYGTITFRLNDRFSLPVTYLRDNVGPFTQQSLFFRLVAKL